MDPLMESFVMTTFVVTDLFITKNRLNRDDILRMIGWSESMKLPFVRNDFHAKTRHLQRLMEKVFSLQTRIRLY